tara:strand:- start:456 stop:734 length:279 start_codon:yes stop_codon:yes gene_type:complete
VVAEEILYLQKLLDSAKNKDHTLTIVQQYSASSSETFKGDAREFIDAVKEGLTQNKKRPMDRTVVSDRDSPMIDTTSKARKLNDPLAPHRPN